MGYSPWSHKESDTTERLLFLSIVPFGEGNGNPLQYSCLENSMDGGGWWATVHRVAKSRTQLSDFASLRTRSAGSQGHLGVWLPRSPPPLVEEERNMREHLPSSGEPLPRRL